jgi:hypothetical protein
MAQSVVEPQAAEHLRREGPRRLGRGDRGRNFDATGIARAGFGVGTGLGQEPAPPASGAIKLRSNGLERVNDRIR